MNRFNVEGMSCNHCVQAVTRAVQALDAAASVRVDLASAQVDIDSSASREALAKAIEDAGYTVKN